MEAFEVVPRDAMLQMLNVKDSTASNFSLVKFILTDHKVIITLHSIHVTVGHLEQNDAYL